MVTRADEVIEYGRIMKTMWGPFQLTTILQTTSGTAWTTADIGSFRFTGAACGPHRDFNPLDGDDPLDALRRQHYREITREILEVSLGASSDFRKRILV
jgi:hypothetical protein